MVTSDQTEENTYLLFLDEYTWNIHKEWNGGERVRQRDVCLWRFHSLWAQHPHNHIHHLESSPEPKYLCCWGFKKQAYWLKHWCLVIDLNLSACPSSRGRRGNYKPLFSSLSVSIQSWVFGIPLVYGYQTVFRKSSYDLWKQSKFQEFQEASSMKQEKGQSWIW